MFTQLRVTDQWRVSLVLSYDDRSGANVTSRLRDVTHDRASGCRLLRLDTPDDFGVYAGRAGRPFCLCWVKPRPA